MGHRFVPTAARTALAFLLLAALASSSLPWNTPNYQEQRGPIVAAGRSSPVGNLSYFAELDRVSGRIYHQSGHAYVIEHAIRLLREDGFPNWADFLIKILTIYASRYSSGMGLVNLDVEVDPRINFAYPSGPG